MTLAELANILHPITTIILGLSLYKAWCKIEELEKRVEP